MRVSLKVGAQSLCKVLGRCDLEALLALFAPLDLSEDLLFGLGSEASELADLMGSCCALEVFEGLDAEGFVQPMHALRTKARNRCQRRQCRRSPRLDLGQSAKPPRLHDLGYFAREIFADPGQAHQGLALGNHLGCALRQVLDGQRGAAVGANAKRVSPFDLE